jgi:hypothetical protein
MLVARRMVFIWLEAKSVPDFDALRFSEPRRPHLSSMVLIFDKHWVLA